MLTPEGGVEWVTPSRSRWLWAEQSAVSSVTTEPATTPGFSDVCESEGWEGIIVADAAGRVLAHSGKWEAENLRVVATAFVPVANARENIIREGVTLEFKKTLEDDQPNSFYSESLQSSSEAPIGEVPPRPAFMSPPPNRARTRSVAFIEQKIDVGDPRRILHMQRPTSCVLSSLEDDDGAKGETSPVVFTPGWALCTSDTPSCLAATTNSGECPPSTSRSCFYSSRAAEGRDTIGMRKEKRCFEVTRWAPPLILARDDNGVAAVAMQATAGDEVSYPFSPDEIFIIVIVFKLPLLTSVGCSRLRRWLVQSGMTIAPFLQTQIATAPGSVPSPLLRMRDKAPLKFSVGEAVDEYKSEGENSIVTKDDENEGNNEELEEDPFD